MLDTWYLFRKVITAFKVVIIIAGDIVLLLERHRLQFLLRLYAPSFALFS
jgi:hypothetical protein